MGVVGIGMIADCCCNSVLFRRLLVEILAGDGVCVPCFLFVGSCFECLLSDYRDVCRVVVDHLSKRYLLDRLALLFGVHLRLFLSVDIKKSINWIVNWRNIQWLRHLPFICNLVLIASNRIILDGFGSL